MEIKIKPVLDLKGISFSYPGEKKKVIDDLDLKLYRGSRLGLVAPNGSGKTTLFHIIMGLEKPGRGIIRFNGREISSEKDFEAVRRKTGFLFQDADDQLFCPTVIEDVAFGPLNLGKSKEEAMEASFEVLRLLGLEGFESRITFKLSGGEKRLVSLAAVLAMKPELLLLDEPTTGLDSETKSKLTGVLTGLNLSYIVISHELDFINSVSDRIYSMDAGKIVMDEELHIHQHAHVHRHGKQPHEHITLMEVKHQ